MKQTIYLDNGATTKVDKSVVTAMCRYHDNHYGNASSIHHKGQEAQHALKKARMIIADSIDADPLEIIFSSGGTESNNLAIKGIAFANRKKGNHIITSKIEHDCVINSCRWLEGQGFNVTYLDVDPQGFIRLDQLRSAITDQTILVSIIHGNNEIGTVQDLKSIYAICKKRGVVFHTDACQSYTKTDLSCNHADLITINSHKIHGPKGVGGLFIKKGIRIIPLSHGGGHERNLRSGTENIAGIVGFSKAVEVAMRQRTVNVEKMARLRDYFIERLLKIPKTILNGTVGSKRLCNNINVSFEQIEGESIVAALDQFSICASTGSACSSHSLDPSHVIMALENNPERAHGSIRFSISRFTTKKEIDFALEKVKFAVNKLRDISPLTK